MNIEVIRDPAADGQTNMDKDRWMFERVESGENLIILRIYAWQPRAISLGAHQNIQDLNWDLINELNLTVVRRLTGGGAILHENELTYSWAVPRAFFGDQSVQATLEWSSQALVSFYQSLGLQAKPAHQAYQNATLGMRTVACYAGKERWDLVVHGRKIGGNAQRRGRRAIFQHGSIPLYLDWELICSLTLTSLTPESPTCLSELLPMPLDRGYLEQKLEESWRRSFQK